MADSTTTSETTHPLTPSHVATLNVATTTATRPVIKRDSSSSTTMTSVSGQGSYLDPDASEGDSSPFLDTSAGRIGQDHQQENVSPSKPPRPRPMSRIISGGELSPLKILQDRPAAPVSQAPEGNQPPANGEMAPPASAAPTTVRSPRKPSWPDRRFPVRISSPKSNGANTASPPPHAPSPLASPRAASPRAVHERHMSLDNVMREDPGLQKAIAILEDDTTEMGESEEEADDLTLSFDDKGPAGLAINGGSDRGSEVGATADESVGPDDTMLSTFSTFSAVPNMTMFAKIGHTPSKHADLGVPTPRASRDGGRPSSPSYGSRPSHYSDARDTTNLLLEFTEQLRFSQAQQQAQAHGRISPSRTTPNLAHGGSATVAATPNRKSMVNLLDFDIPPMPTPRSVPTITPRELESLKSNFLSEISSLKASLSGKEAEAMSLKVAVGDAEKRVGACMEQLREEETMREQIQAERDDWERRGREMEAVLRKVKEEIVMGQRERDELEAKLDESEKRREMAETMAQEAESKVAAMRAGKAAEAAMGGADRAPSSSPAGPNGEKALTPRDVEMAVEKVARELHALYKGKHTEKITALKKSYERRWERRVRELEEKIDDLSRENEDIRAGRHATMTRIDPAAAALEEERKAKAAHDSAQITELHAEVEKLEAVIRTVQMDNDDMRKLLEQERVEKGELVQLAEEMMNMQQSFIGSNATPAPKVPTTARKQAPAAAPQQAPPTPSRGAATPGRPLSRIQAPETVRAGANPNRISGLRAPGSIAAPKSRIGGPAQQYQRNKSPTLSGPQAGPRSGIMSSIEKMGSYKGRLE